MENNKSIKRGTTPTLLISVDGIAPENVEKIEFIFKSNRTESDKELLRKVFPGDDVDYNAYSKFYRVSLTDAETRIFSEGRIFMDTRVTLIGGKIPATDIVSFNVTDTLFQDVSE